MHNDTVCHLITKFLCRATIVSLSKPYPVCAVDPAAAASCWAAGGRSSTLTTAQRALKRRCAATTPRTNSCPRLSLVSCPPATGVALRLASYGGRAELPVTRTHVLGLRTCGTLADEIQCYRWIRTLQKYTCEVWDAGVRRTHLGMARSSMFTSSWTVPLMVACC